MTKYFIPSTLILLLTATLARTQPPPRPARAPEAPPAALAPALAPVPPPPPAARPPMRALSGGPGRWWSNPDMVQKLALTSDQQKKMDDIFHQHRLRLIDLNAALEKEEVNLEPLVAADQPDEPKILAQIDRVAQARAELEKANARMLLGIRRLLTTDQWKKLESENLQPRPRRAMAR